VTPIICFNNHEAKASSTLANVPDIFGQNYVRVNALLVVGEVTKRLTFKKFFLLKLLL